MLDLFAHAKMKPTEISPEWLDRFAARHGWERRVESSWWSVSYDRDSVRISVRWVNRKVTAVEVTGLDGVDRRITGEKVVSLKALVRAAR
jgi:hypothetical protein